MAFQPLKILVFEAEFFIALEIERSLGEQLGCSVFIRPLNDWVEALSEEEFDIVVVSLSRSRQVNLQRVGDARMYGAGIVFTTSYSARDRQSAGIGEWPLVDIPFRDQDLADAVRLADTLSTRRR